MNPKALVWFFTAIAYLGGLAAAQEQVDPKDVLKQMAEARAKIEQYEVFCDVKGDPGHLALFFVPDHKQSNESHAEIWIQSAPKDQHLLTAVRDLTGGAKEAKWIIGGVSDSIEIHNKNRDMLLARDIGRFGTIFKETDDRTRNHLFDPLTIGMGFNSDFLMGRTFDSQVESLLDWCKIPTSHATLADGVVTWNYNFFTTIKFDTKRSYWPISLRWIDGGKLAQELDVELGKFKEFDVPVRAVIKSTQPKKGDSKTEIEFKWESINQPIETGEKCIKLLEERFIFADP